jgi:hypothetical protein
MATIQTEPIAAETSRAAVNRQNAQHSTGPITPEGKEAVRLNALKTGLYAKTVLLPHEDRATYEEIGADLMEDYNPQTSHEKRLAQSIHDTEWRIKRVIDIETKLHLIVAVQHLESIETQFGLDDATENLRLAQVSGFLANSRVFDQLNRQEARLRKLRTQQINEACALIANRPPASKAAPEAAPPPPPEPSGFVSPKPETQAPSAAKPSVLDGVPQRVLDRMPTFVGKTAEMHQAQWLKKHWKA